MCGDGHCDLPGSWLCAVVVTMICQGVGCVR